MPVYGVGHEEGIHYYAMQYIPGQPLDAVLKELRRLRRRHHEPAGKTVGTRAGRVDERPSAADLAISLCDDQFAPDPAGSHGPSEPRLAATTVAVPARPADAIAPTAVAVATPDRPSSPGSDVLSSSVNLTGTGRRYARAVARIGIQVAEALEYAAEQGVIHRDVKPSNILLDLAGNAWVTDFGLAKVVGQEDLTHTGDLVGTLRYMAPERFRGQADGRGDVYALGLTLYELLALRPAFDESDRARLIERILHDSPSPPRQLDRHIPRDLETIVLKAMAREPAERVCDGQCTGGGPDAVPGGPADRGPADDHHRMGSPLVQAEPDCRRFAGVDPVFVGRRNDRLDGRGLPVPGPGAFGGPGEE